VVALDAAPSMLVEAGSRLARFGDRVELVEADLTQPLPIPPPVEAVVSTAALHWVLDHDRLFAHLAAVLRPGGRLVAQCGGVGNIASVVDILRRLGRAEPSPWLFATPADTRRRLEGAGFTDVDAWLHDEPTPIDAGEPIRTFLATVILRSHLERLPEGERQPLVEAVAEGLGPEPVLDYVRLTMVATRA
jgi:trans-aconitate 2-methyltransferase